jgi:DNA-binding NtrC family response regulator
VVQIKIPALRERKSDIPLLVTSFLDKFSDPHRPARTISEDAMRRLSSYDWPGNVRELENAIERAVALGSGPILHVADLPSSLQYPSSKRVPERDELLPLEELERRAILRTLRQTTGDKLAVARILGIGKTTLYPPQAEAISYAAGGTVRVRGGHVHRAMRRLPDAISITRRPGGSVSASGLLSG